MEAVAAKIARRAYRELEISAISMPDFDLRTEVPSENVHEMSASIAKYGMLQPILVRLNASKRQGAPTYTLVMGGVRVRGAKEAGKTTVPAYIVDGLTSQEALILAFIENIQRFNLNTMEEARVLEELRDVHEMGAPALAEEINKPYQYVDDRLTLLTLPGAIQKMVASGLMSMGQALAVAKLGGSHEKQLAFAERIVDQGLSAEIAARIVEEATSPTRSYRRMTRMHRLKRRGAPLKETLLQRIVQRVVLRCESLLTMLNGVAIKRWSPEWAAKLRDAVAAMQQGLEKVRRRAEARAREKE